MELMVREDCGGQFFLKDLYLQIFLGAQLQLPMSQDRKLCQRQPKDCSHPNTGLIKLLRLGRCVCSHMA